MSNETCSFQGIFEDQFQTYPFNNTAGISFWHLRSARFGHTNDIQYLIDGTQSQGEDYLRGLLASSIIIFCIAVVWCILLLAFKWIGPRRVGWLSGRHVPLPSNPAKEGVALGDDNKVEEGPTAWERKYNKIIRGRNIMKALVVVAGIGIIANSIMLSVKGVNDLIQTLDGIDYVVNYSIGLMEEGVAIIDSVLYTEQQLTNQTTAAWDAINGICPELLQPICSNVSDVETCNFQEVLQNYTDLVDFLTLLAATRNEIYDQLNRTKSDLLDSIAFASSISDVSQTFNWAFWCSLVFSLVTAIISLFFIYRAIRPPTKKSRCSCRNVFVIPSFVLLVFLSWIFAIVFVIGSIGLADMCYDSPDDNVKALLQRMQNKFSPLMYKAVLFYVSGCPLGQAVSEIAVFVSYLAFFFQSASAAVQSLDFQNVASVCGVQSIARASNATHYVSTSVCQLADLFREIHLYLQCANWYPLYDEGVYQAMCYRGTSGFVWVTSTQIAIVVCSMVILSLRVVFHDIEMEVPTESVEDKEAYVNDVEEQDAKPDEEQAFAAAVVVAQRDYVPGKDETEVVESVPVSDDDAKEVLTLPLEDSETMEGDNGDVVFLPLISQDPRALAGDDLDAQASEPVDDLGTEADKDIVVASDLASQEKVLDETEDSRSIIEDEKAQAVQQEDEVVLIPAVMETDEKVLHDESMIKADQEAVEGEEPVEEMKNLEAQTDKEVVGESALEPETGRDAGSVENPVQTDVLDEDAEPMSNVGNDVTKDVAVATTIAAAKNDLDQDDVLVQHDSRKDDQPIVHDGKVVESDKNDVEKIIETGKKGTDTGDSAKPVKESKGAKESEGSKRSTTSTKDKPAEKAHPSSIVEDNQAQAVTQNDIVLPAATSELDPEADAVSESDAKAEQNHDIIEPIVEEDHVEAQDNTVLLPETREIEPEAEIVTETGANAVESHEEPGEESEGHADVEDIDGSSPLTENEKYETKDPSSIDEEKPQDIDQDNGVLIPDTKEIHEQVVGNENLAVIDDQGDASDEADEALEGSKANSEEVAVETTAASAENTHGEKDDAPLTVDDVDTHHVAKDNAMLSPNSLATEESSRSVAADEIWLWHAKGVPEATKDANSDDEDLE